MDSPDDRVIRVSASARWTWLSQLIQASGPAGVADVIVRWLQAETGRQTTLVWWGNDGTPACHGSDRRVASDEQTRQAAALLEGSTDFALAGSSLLFRAVPNEHIVLLLALAPDEPPAVLIETVQPWLEPAGRQLARALQLAHLYDSHRQLKRSEALQRALFAISDLAGSELDMPEMLRHLHAIISTLMYGENFFIVMSNPERGTMRFLYYADAEDLDRPDTSIDYSLEDWRHTLTWHLLRSGKSLMGSLPQLGTQVAGPLVSAGPDCIDWLGVPMMRNGQAHGALVVQSYKPGIGFADDDRILLEFVGSHVLTALERKHSKDELEQRVLQRTAELAEANFGLQLEVIERQRAERLQAALFHIAQLATADIDQDTFYQRLHAVVGQLIDARNFFIGLVTPDGGMIEFPYYRDERMPSPGPRPLGRGLSEYVLRHGEPLMATKEEIERLGAIGQVDLLRIGAPALCWLGVPLRVGDNVIGVVVVQSYNESVVYQPADRELLSFAALQIANSIDRRSSAASLQRAYGELEQRVEERTQELRQQIQQREQAQQQLQHEVLHDGLTGLPNRGFLRDRLDRVLGILKREPGRRCALLYLDVDRFKIINDSLGHLAGDEVLKEVARRLMQCVRDPDVVARLSGDEFAILLEDVEIPAAAIAVAQRVLETLGLPLLVAGRELEPSASIGIAVGDDRYTSADELLRDADVALYRAKELGRKRYEIFDETLAKNVVDVLTMEGEIRHALLHDEFEPHLQPVCRLGNGEVVGYEALLRWNHPQHGLIPPAVFVKIAEDSGYIEQIDWRMFELSCRRLLQLPERGTYLTINISALHLRHADFDVRLVRMLDRVGLPPERLVVEVTEGALLDNPEQVRDTLERLQVIGVGAALDDFGTGYSSLSYLHSLPLRMLKIDRAFVQALDERVHNSTTTVVAAILALAQALSIQVIAEGIETEAQRRALTDMGCEFGQGYLLGRPGPVEHWMESAPSMHRVSESLAPSL